MQEIIFSAFQRRTKFDLRWIAGLFFNFLHLKMTKQRFNIFIWTECVIQIPLYEHAQSK